jgi:hypothetical protein
MLKKAILTKPCLSKSNSSYRHTYHRLVEHIKGVYECEDTKCPLVILK